MQRTSSSNVIEEREVQPIQQQEGLLSESARVLRNYDLTNITTVGASAPSLADVATLYVFHQAVWIPGYQLMFGKVAVERKRERTFLAWQHSQCRRRNYAALTSNSQWDLKAPSSICMTDSVPYMSPLSLSHMFVTLIHLSPIYSAAMANVFTDVELTASEHIVSTAIVPELAPHTIDSSSNIS